MKGGSTVRDRLLIVWIATLGITRIDLLGGAGGFLLTPFLALVPLLALLEARQAVVRGGRLRLPTRGQGFYVLVSLLLSVVLLSTFLSHDLETSLRRTFLLYLQVVGVLVGGLALVNHPRAARLLGRGAMAGLGVALAFNVLQVLHWFGFRPVGGMAERVITLEPGNYGGLIPRLTGSSHDPNLGGLLILCYIFLVLMLHRESRWRTLLIGAGVVSILLTFSRSAILAAMALMAVAVLLRPRRRIAPVHVLTGAAGVGTAMLVLLFVPAALNIVEGAWELLGGRLSLEEGSTSEHAAVLARGWEVATYDAKQFLVGIGYGNAYTTLHDIFPGNRYGNYHSLFLTLFAEAGIIAAVLGIVLFGWAFAAGGPYRPIIAALIVYNLFQQSQTDPMTWLLLTLAWTGAGWPENARDPAMTMSESVVGDVPNPELIQQ